MKKLYKFDADCGRMGSIEGLFITDESSVEKIMGKEVYFNEVLGKHSEICLTMTADILYPVSEDQDLINKLIDVLGDDLCGYNPITFYEDYNYDEEE